ncbi:MAG: globin [Rhizobacter sp.]|nr:globin [Rhizobacter sp.]
MNDFFVSTRHRLALAAASFVLAAGLLTSVGSAGSAMAQTSAAAKPTMPKGWTPPDKIGHQDDPLFIAFGGKPGLTALVDDFMGRLLIDRRMSPFFKDIDQDDFKHKLVQQLCDVAGGPCVTVNPDMKKTHAGVDIRRADFIGLVEVLQDTMSARGISFSDQNRLLARLAPMHREIVNTR